MKIEQRGIVTESLKGNQFKVQLQDNETHIVIATPCGKMKTHRIVPCMGDEVTVEISPYDLTRGRITWRH